MAFAYDSHRLHRLLEDAEGIALGAGDLELQLTTLIGVLESDAPSMVVPAVGTSLAPEIDTAAIAALPTSSMGSGLLASIRTICLAAHAHRARADAIVTGFVGQHARLDGAARPRVLVVDDSQANLDVVTLVLEDAGFDTITARNGLDALIVAHYVRPAAILMDLAMPVLGGIDSARLLKSSTTTQSINVIAYTGERSLLDASSLSLFADVVAKPATPIEILTSVRRFASDLPSAEPAAGN
jgi:CheY-like chemotaxis protein